MTQHANNSFMQDVQIVLWDTSGADYWSFFSDMWKVFSHKPPIHLRSFDGKKVLFALRFSSRVSSLLLLFIHCDL